MNKKYFVINEITFDVSKSHANIKSMIELLLNIQTDMQKCIDICGDVLEKDYNCPSFFKMENEIQKLLNNCSADELEE